MAPNLRSRLSRLRERGKSAPPKKPAPLPETAAFEKLGWTQVAYLTLRRTQSLELPFPIPQTLPPSLGFLVPALPAPPETLVFFDLETTGLSIGAGTIAFLAAFGTLEAPGKLRLTQYLLLDYPGESDFLEALLKEFSPQSTVVSYNGKTFDAQILRTRCLMNGLPMPAFNHADLLHPARRLWRRTLPNCSQGTIETEILSLSREGDLSGAFAPEAWFNFLKTTDAEALLQICDHNSRDILGLASLLGCLCTIAAAPLKAEHRYRADIEQLYFCWLRGEHHAMTRTLLKRGAEKGYPRCCRKLAIEAEWRSRDNTEALRLVEKALEAGENDSLGALSATLRQDLENRRTRLLKKIL